MTKQTLSLAILFFAFSAHAQTVPTDAFLGTYYSDEAFTTAVATRNDPQVNFEFGTASPISGVGATSYSIRWVGNINLPAGSEKFAINVRGGATVYVDGTAIVSARTKTTLQSLSGRTTLTAGVHRVQVDYKKDSGDGLIQLSMLTQINGGAWMTSTIASASGTPGNGSGGTTPTPPATPTPKPPSTPTPVPTPVSTPVPPPSAGAPWLLPSTALKLPADLPTTHFHLTARPWEPLAISTNAYLDRVEGEVKYWSTQQETNGAIRDPEKKAEEGATNYFAYPAAELAVAGRTSYLSNASLAMDYATNIYANATWPSGSGPDFFIAGIMDALPTFDKLAMTKPAWRSAATKEYNYTNPNNWATYTQLGRYKQYKEGLISAGDAQSTVESVWTNTQKSRFNINDYGLYQDESSKPDTLSVETVGRYNYLDLIDEGYAGPSAAAISADVTKGSLTSLLMQDPSGQVPNGGRTDDHVWVDAGYQLIYEIMAKRTTDPTLAGAYAHAAQLTFQNMDRWKLSDGNFSVTKNFYPASQRVGFQSASMNSAYNVQMAYLTAASYEHRTSSAEVKEQAAPVEIGGYALGLGDGFDKGFVNAGGTAIEIGLQGQSSASSNGNQWSPLGITRIGRVGWDTRLGPSDGRYDGTNGVSFAPTWSSGGAWKTLASTADGYEGTFTTAFASPALTQARVVWAPKTANSGPTFQQDLTATPDGVLSQTSCLSNCGAAGSWGMTLPLLASDGASTLLQGMSGRIASTSYSSSGDEENFIAINSAGASMSAGTAILSTYGYLTPVRSVTTDPSNIIFIYPRSPSDPSAASVRDSFAMTSTGFKSSLGVVHGTLYSGRTAAGGYGTSIDSKGDGVTDVTLSVPCNFILQLKAGAVVSIEADRAVTAVVRGQSVTLSGYVPHSF